MNSMYYHIFAKKRCKYCTKAKNLLKERKLPHVVTNMDNASEALEELKEHCGWKTVPIIYKVSGDQGALVGGYTDLEEYLNGTPKEEESSGEETDNFEED